MNFDITKAKFYQEIMSGLASLFGVNTEAEIHAALEKTPTMQAMQDAAIAAVQDQMDGIKTTVADLTTQVADLTASLAAKDGEITALTEKVTGLQTALDKKEAEMAALITQHATERNTLSGEVARLRAGKLLETDTETESVTGEAGGVKPAGHVVKAEKIEAFFGAAAKN